MTGLDAVATSQFMNGAKMRRVAMREKVGLIVRLIASDLRSSSIPAKRSNILLNTDDSQGACSR